MITKVVLAAIRLFQKTRILRQPACRFYPSCSDYAHGCIDRHGLVKGMLLACWRVLRCQPLHPGGIDEVPMNFKLRIPGNRKSNGRTLPTLQRSL
jgi:putative membrane protein insertion efficiency factor